MPFYTDNDDQFILDSALSFFEKNGISQLKCSDVEEFNFTSMFNSIPVEGNWIATPKASMVNIPIPYEVLDHDEKTIGLKSIEEIISNHINSKFMDEKYIISGRPDIFFGIKFRNFSYEILREISSGHLTTPMILIDKSMDRVFFFEYDLAVNSYSRSNNLKYEYLGDIEDKIWIEFFSENFLNGISYNQHHVELVKKYYRKYFIDVV